MAKYRKSDFKSAIDRIRELPADRRGKIEAGASRILEQAGKPVKSRIKIETTPPAE